MFHKKQSTKGKSCSLGKKAKGFKTAKSPKRKFKKKKLISILPTNTEAPYYEVKKDLKTLMQTNIETNKCTFTSVFF